MGIRIWQSAMNFSFHSEDGLINYFIIIGNPNRLVEGGSFWEVGELQRSKESRERNSKTVNTLELSDYCAWAWD